MRIRSRFKKHINNVIKIYYSFEIDDEQYRKLRNDLSPRKWENMMNYRVRKYHDYSKRKYKKKHKPKTGDYTRYDQFDTTSILCNKRMVSAERYRHSNVKRSRVKDIHEGYIMVDKDIIIEKLHLPKNTTMQDLVNINLRNNMFEGTNYYGKLKPCKGNLWN